MKASESQRAFESMVAETGAALSDLAIDQAFACMFRFYRDERAEDRVAGRNMDMLLFQWRCDRTAGQFEIDLTRQFVTGCEDEDVWQLSLTFIFPLSEDLVGLGSSNKWCPEPRPRAVDYFEAFVKGSEAYRAVLNKKPLRVDIDYHSTG